MTADSDRRFIDPEGYKQYGGYANPRDVFSFKNILMMHIKSIIDLGSVEWHGGYMKQTQVSLDNNRTLITESHVQDTRQAWGNAILMFCAFIEPKMTMRYPKEGKLVDKPDKEPIIELKKKCLDLSRKIQTGTADANASVDYVEAHYELFILLNTFCARNNYWTMMGTIE